MIVDQIKRALLRRRFILRVVPFALPVLAGFLLGLLWLKENGLLLQFFLTWGALGLAVYLGLNLPLWLQRREDAAEHDQPAEHHVAENPDWSASEKAAFDAGRSLIDKTLVKPLPVDEMQPFALRVIQDVARASGQVEKSELDFTIPEALLLVERVASRLRSDFKSHIPVSDRISVRTLFWLWQNQGRARKLYDFGNLSYRMLRVATNLPAAVIRELSDAVISGNKSMLTGELHVLGQRILFEEIAKAATELYSGRLRMSDAELLESILQDANIDRARLAAPDAPLRIAIAGQVSAGKSSLANALLGHDAAETDMPSTTDQQTAYESEILGMPCHILDLPGLDGSEVAAQATLEEALRCDILLWTLPANRAAREIDRAAIAAIRAQFAKAPDRRIPPLIGIATFCDRLTGDAWPYPEHDIPNEVQSLIGDAVRSIAQELTIDTPIPVALGENDWNVPVVLQTLEAHFFEAVNVQRNRVRLTQANKTIGREAFDTVHGVGRGVLKIGRRAAERYRPNRRK
ncbi:GTPase family protein [Roseovarius sp.]|uniref:GTPase family protein n=1 Tax=Roseovarius sp. TaxID=1486281 RepID=UPI0035679D94